MNGYLKPRCQSGLVDKEGRTTAQCDLPAGHEEFGQPTHSTVLEWQHRETGAPTKFNISWKENWK